MAGGAVAIAKRAARLMLAVTMIQVATQAASPAAAETLIVQGSTTFNRRIMEPFHSQIEATAGHVLTIIPNKSTPGLIGLMEGRAHLSMISAPLRTEIDILRQVAPGMAYDLLREFNISTTQIAIGVHQSNPVRKASAETIAKILRGDIKNWKEIGGPDLPIRVVLVGGGGGVTAVVESELLRGQTGARRARLRAACFGEAERHSRACDRQAASADAQPRDARRSDAGHAGRDRRHPAGRPENDVAA